MLHYKTYELDPKAEWVTFIHGAGGSSAIWFKQIRDFRKHYNVLLVDLRGHGQSPKPNYSKVKTYTFDVISDDIIQVLDHLQIASTHFIGISLGTIIIREITERYPERTKSMILGGAVMKFNWSGRVMMKVGIHIHFLMPYLFLYKCLAFLLMPRKKHRECRDLFINEARKLYQKEFNRWFTLVPQINPLLKFLRNKESAHPILYIMGSEDYMFLNEISKLVKKQPSSKLIIVPACGHVVNIEKPNLFNQKSLEFLRKF